MTDARGRTTSSIQRIVRSSGWLPLVFPYLFPGEEDVTSKTFPSLDVDTTQEEEDNDVEEGGSPEMESEDPLEPHEMSSEERRKVHLLEYGGPSPAPTTPVAEFPVVRTTPSSDDRPKESPPTRGTTMKRRNQSIYTEPDDED